MTYAYIEAAQIKFAKDGEHVLRGKLIKWEITESRGKNIQVLIEMCSAGASRASVDEILTRWKIKDTDMEKFAKTIQVTLDYEVGVWYAVKTVGRTQLVCGSAVNPFYAFVDLWQKMITVKQPANV